MDKIQKVADLVNQLGCPVRIKPKEYSSETWTTGIGLPTNNYVELNGPWAFRDVDWLEINPIVMEHIGRLIKPKRHDHINEIISLLKLEKISCSIIEGMVRVSFKAFE